jgi:hypothetical protein
VSDGKVARGRARSAIFQAVSLSVGARLVYLFLDDMDWNSQGLAWPKQTTIAAKLGLSTREVQRCLGELAAGGHVRIERKKAHCIYRLGWNDTTARSYLKNEHTTGRSHQDTTGRSYSSIYEAIEVETTCTGGSVENCSRCSGDGWYWHEATKRGGVRSSSVVVCGCRELSLNEAVRLSMEKKRA